MKHFILLLIMSMSTVLFAQEETTKDNPIKVPQIAVKVGLHESIEIRGIQLHFLEVLEDSRCPKNVECVWAGQAKISVKIIDNNRNKTIKTLLFSGITSPSIGIFDDFELIGLKLAPYPDEAVKVADRAPYVLLVGTKQIAPEK